MQPTKVEKDHFNIGVFAEFTLASGDVVTVDAGWSNNEGERWSFDCQMNAKNRNDWDIKVRDGQPEYVARAIAEVSAKATQAEVNAISKYIADYKEKSTPNYSAHSAYYGE